jgi:hypothetical protein
MVAAATAADTMVEAATAAAIMVGATTAEVTMAAADGEAEPTSVLGLGSATQVTPMGRLATTMIPAITGRMPDTPLRSTITGASLESASDWTSALAEAADGTATTAAADIAMGALAAGAMVALAAAMGTQAAEAVEVGRGITIRSAYPNAYR